MRTKLYLLLTLGILSVAASSLAFAVPFNSVPEDTIYRISWREGFRKAEYFDAAIKAAPKLYEHYTIVPKDRGSAQRGSQCVKTPLGTTPMVSWTLELPN